MIDFTETNQYVALVIKKNSKYPKMIPLFDEKDLQSIISEFSGNNYSYINSLYGKNREVNTKLYNIIWKPLEKELSGIKKVFISPDGLLHKVSFAAIARKQNVYLCDAYDIQIKTSTSKLINTENTDRSLQLASIYGGIDYNTDSTSSEIWSYLEGSKRETDNIAKFLKEKNIEVKHFDSRNATEEQFKLWAGKSDLLHLSTHGFFYPNPEYGDEEVYLDIEQGDVVFRGGARGVGVQRFVNNNNPLMRSGLVLAGANNVWQNDTIEIGEDGVLTAQEVAHIDMRNTELVVMSACETGLGDIKGSEGVYGLQRAFKMAGVKYLVMSLWQVPDKETAEFMTLFYQLMIAEKDIQKAFSMAQKEMRKNYDPYFWGAFLLIE